MRGQHVVKLPGCTPAPLAGYLKALAILRLVSVRDHSACGWWERDVFCMQSSLSLDDLLDHFLMRYEPTPIVAPWNGGSGFYEKDSKEAKMAIGSSQTDRLRVYRATLDIVDTILGDLGIREKPEKEDKRRLVERCRAFLPDEAVDWLDSVILLTTEDLAFPALLGTGGNDGRLEFTNNFMQRVCELFDLKEGLPTSQSVSWLRAALLQDTTSGLVDAAVGQFNPGSVGGPNARAGFEGNSRVNPWDFVLTMEGALVFSASANRRLAVNGTGTLSFPFTALPSSVGYASNAKMDRAGARTEMWMPLWGRPTTYSEISFIFREGRAQVNNRAVRDGLDFARACSSLGVDRGIESFQRYAFLMRSGKAYLSVPLTRFPVKGSAETNLIDEIDPWLRRVSIHAGGKTTPESLKSAQRGIEEQIYDLCLRPGPLRVQEMLIALGQMERQIRLSPEVRSATREPLYLKNGGWIDKAWDGSPEFEIACALAGMRDGMTYPLRVNFSPVDLERWSQWSRAEGKELPPRVVWSDAPLSQNLIRVMRRRMLDQQIYRKEPRVSSKTGLDKPYQSFSSASLASVIDFIDGRVEDRRIQDLLWGCILMDPRVRIPTLRSSNREALAVPWIFAVLKLVFSPDKILCEIFGRKGWRVPIPDSIWGLLQAGTEKDLEKAVDLAEQRLFASGLALRKPLRQKVSAATLDPKRMAAALAIPISIQDTRVLVRMVCVMEGTGGEGEEEKSGEGVVLK